MTDETPAILVPGQQDDEEWEAFVERVVARFRAAGLLDK